MSAGQLTLEQFNNEVLLTLYDIQARSQVILTTCATILAKQNNSNPATELDILNEMVAQATKINMDQTIERHK